MRRTILALATLASLTACDRGVVAPSKSDAQRRREADPVIMAERRSAGRWRSEPGILPGDKALWVIIDIAGTKDMRIERRGMSGRYESVYASASGKVDVKPEGISAEAPDADGSLRPFRSFSATFPSATKMLVKSGEQTFLFTFSGV